MRYTVKKSVIDVVGKIWLPAVTCSMRYTVSAHDVENMRDDDGKITRDSVDQWLACHSGDFQSVQDFRASIEDVDKTVDIEFSTEDGYLAYCDTIPEF